jgi:hypothetical protein
MREKESEMRDRGMPDAPFRQAKTRYKINLAGNN